MHTALDFLVGTLHCRIINIDASRCEEEDSRYYDHNHFCTEIHWIETGSSDYICDKTRYHVDPGQLLIIPPGIYHRKASVAKACERLSILVDIASPTEKPNALEDYFLRIFRPETVQIYAVDSAELTQIHEHIHWLMDRGETDSISMERLRIACNRFFVELLALLAGDSLLKTENTSKNTIPEDMVLENHIAYRFMPGASFSMLAEQLHVSPRQLHRIITQKYGINYRDKMKEIRIEIATNFLRNTDKSIAQIAQIMGYSDTSSFSSFIKRATGRTPRQIRKAGMTE